MFNMALLNWKLKLVVKFLYFRSEVNYYFVEENVGIWMVVLMKVFCCLLSLPWLGKGRTRDFVSKHRSEIKFNSKTFEGKWKRFLKYAKHTKETFSNRAHNPLTQ